MGQKKYLRKIMAKSFQQVNNRPQKSQIQKSQKTESSIKQQQKRPLSILYSNYRKPKPEGKKKSENS